jgi:hypothetical protein
MFKKFMKNISSPIWFSITLIALANIISGCSLSHSYPRITVPKNAYDVSIVQPDRNQYGVKFTINVPNYSYKYFSAISTQIVDQGYAKCQKSAISNWQPMPGQLSKNDNLIVTMFATRKRDKFIVVRVEQLNKDSGGDAIQRFSIAFQDVSHGKPNLSNISEFCD